MAPSPRSSSPSGALARAAGAAALWLPLVACGGGGGDSPDARPRFDAPPLPDATPKPLCFYDLDANCGYTPTPLLRTQISASAQQALAERYNPAMVYTAPNIWAVSVNYLLVEGGPLMVAPHEGRLNFSYKVDEENARPAYEGTQPDLTATNWSGLPTSDGTDDLVYFIDAPGENLGPELDAETWSTEWVRIQGDEPATAAYPPLQYAYLFWLHEPDRLLAIQYWFYYPYDKFNNNHEGDWEHVNVVLRYPEQGEPTLLFAHFSYHGRQIGALAEDLYRVADLAGHPGGDGDHVVVFVGGFACTTYPPTTWCGDASGASFPYPGTYDLGYIEEVAGDTGRPGRRIHANDFTVELLPRLEDADFDAHPALSWYGLPMIFGEPTTAVNAEAVIFTNNHRAPVGPGPGHDEYQLGIEQIQPLGVTTELRPFDVPGDWTFLSQPPSSVFD
jgi:hypothetical protein